MNETQRRAGGHPNIGGRLGELAAAAGLEMVSYRFVPVMGDARDPARRAAIMRYFLTLMKSAEPQVRAAGTFDARELPSVWAAWEAALAAPDGLFCYTMAKLEARVRWVASMIARSGPKPRTYEPVVATQLRGGRARPARGHQAHAMNSA